jgi:hypothetical protein
MVSSNLELNTWVTCGWIKMATIRLKYFSLISDPYTNNGLNGMKVSLHPSNWISSAQNIAKTGIYDE